MVKPFKDKKYWAVILGGSSGLGLATAKKLAKEGMNIFIIHRDRKSELSEIEKHFNEIISEAFYLLIQMLCRSQIISERKKKLEPDGKIRLLLHSIAKEI